MRTRILSLVGMGRLAAILALTFIIGACGLKAPLPEIEAGPDCRVVRVADGPEDFCVDDHLGTPRFLVSCHERRGPAKTGGIYVFDPADESVFELVRTGEQGRLKAFKPHGMDIRDNGGSTFLYVILHDPQDRGDREENAVGVYQVFADHLDLEELLQDRRHLWSPNDLSVMDNGEIYLTNDYHTDWDLYLKRKASEVAHYQPQTRTWQVAVSDLKLANGILAQDRQVFVSTTQGNTLYAFDRQGDGSLAGRRVIARLKGLDNIMPYAGKLLVTGHFDDLAFLKHRKDSATPSPTAIFLVDPATKSVKPLYADDGRFYSAASTALIFNGRLYASQVFDPYLLVCGGVDLN